MVGACLPQRLLGGVGQLKRAEPGHRWANLGAPRLIATNLTITGFVCQSSLGATCVAIVDGAQAAYGKLARVPNAPPAWRT
jgi:hypothetical protein